jgi:hypothetical protein
VLAGVIAVGLAFAPAPEVSPQPDLGSFVSESPRCPRKVSHCFGIVVHVVTDEDGPVESPAWLGERVEEANRHFALVDVAFRVIEAREQTSEYRHVATRKQRDLIGRDRFGVGVVHLFLVGQLDDVDVADTQIRGVHWRDRGDTSRRWILMSKIASPMVLAHELGHFFGLPHSSYGVSIMNKTPRDDPPFEARTFHRKEIRRMEGFRTFMLFEGQLINRRKRSPNLD